VRQSTDRTTQQLEVWMDGECGLCRRSQEWCEIRDRDRRLRFRDFRTADDRALPAPRATHEGSMWVADTDGSLLEGFAAWRRIMTEFPRWGWLARLAGLPPLSWLGPPLYRLVAAHRHHLS
jgi:predicted DCC family thiol-disulfide oxidoreductase YuxK